MWKSVYYHNNTTIVYFKPVRSIIIRELWLHTSASLSFPYGRTLNQVLTRRDFGENLPEPKKYLRMKKRTVLRSLSLLEILQMYQLEPKALVLLILDLSHKSVWEWNISRAYGSEISHAYRVWWAMWQLPLSPASIPQQRMSVCVLDSSSYMLVGVVSIDNVLEHDIFHLLLLR